MRIILQWRADRRRIWIGLFGERGWSRRMALRWDDGGRWGRPSHRPSISPKLTSSFQSTSTSDFRRRLRIEDNSFAEGIRFKRDSHGQLQTAILTYRKKFPFSIFQPLLRVDLVSTIHIAEKERCLMTSRSLKNSRSRVFYNDFGGSVLWTPTSGGSVLQRLLAKFFTLDFQLDCLDYQADNWYHADLDKETFVSLQNERGENISTFFRDTKRKSREALPREDLGPWRSRRDFGASMRFLLAKGLAKDVAQITADVEDTSVMIGERNRAATRALRRAIDGGNKKIAIIYGAGHMKDLGRRLRKEFDLIPTQVHWITAFSIKNRNLTSSSLPLNIWQTLAFLIISSLLAWDLWGWKLL
ncbi:uncharacterized protein LOC125187375 isoform X2 [Salvia hispanica]|uniref:uncharacterized protein LOC125187375 isoform X2 n=1 Tax=Salvia hispanica TaxID=49212 RepID=UPI00200900ED|nr:uncharacterized protein LOC125187375 isoform X2 [Salvia hispanica]